MSTIHRIDPLQTGDRPDAAFESSWRAGIRRRIALILAILGLWTLSVEARLVQLQVFQHDALVASALGQQEHVSKLRGKRGDIVDRNGEMLAFSVDNDDVVADPRGIKDPARTAELICRALGDCDAADLAAMAEKLSSSRKSATLARQISEQQSARIADLKLSNVTLVPENHRYYPKTDLAAHVLGGVNIDNTGVGGIEAAYDSLIRGHDGRVLVQKDAHRNRMQTWVQQAATVGATLELTIDQYLQHIAERELRAGVEENRALGGTAIVMDPRSGELLALANYPTFNANIAGQYPDDVRRNRAVQEIYEPGSTFKIVTASAALQEGVIKPTDLVDTNPGWIQIGSRKPIKDTHENGVLSFEDVIVNSSNVGAIKTGLRVGAERLDRYIRRFGFGQLLAPDFRGESAGMVTSLAHMNDSAIASMSMGYQVGVTPLQMAAAASAVANGGVLMQPHIVRAVVHGHEREAVTPKMLRQPITPETAAALTTMMEEVVTRGTGRSAQLDDYRVAGKTGTANKVVGGRYSETEFHASFVGFVPSRQPAFTILVVIDTPRAGHHFGGDVAAPIFKRIAEASLRQRGVPATINPAPPVVIVADAGAPAAQPVRATVLPSIIQLGGRTLMPDVRGLGARVAVRLLGNIGLSVSLIGSGVVTAQTPAPGEAVESGGSSVLQLDRLPAEPRQPGSGGR